MCERNKCAYQAPEPEGAREWLATLGYQLVAGRNWISLCHGAPALMRLRMWFPKEQAVFDMQYGRTWLPERERWIPLEGLVQNGWKQSLHALKPTRPEPAEGDELRAILLERWQYIADCHPEVQVWLKPDPGLISRECARRIKESPWRKSA